MPSARVSTAPSSIAIAAPCARYGNVGWADVAEQSDTFTAPLMDWRAVEQRPEIALILVGSVNDGLNDRVPAFELCLELIP